MYEFTGHIHFIGPEQTKGTFTFREIVLQKTRDYNGKTYYDNACFKFSGDRTKELDYFNTGEEVKISFNVKSNEWQGRWFSELSAWKIEPIGDQKPVQQKVPNRTPQTAAAATQKASEVRSAPEPEYGDGQDDLPF
jgi:hypothetical protein